MQSRNGGWAAFDADNTHYLLNHIPFADHGALLDPPTADVSSRCLGFLAQRGYEQHYPAVIAALAFLRREQESDGSWFGRWGANYICGTCSVLAAFNAIGMTLARPKYAAPWHGCSHGSTPTAAGTRGLRLIGPRWRTVRHCTALHHRRSGPCSGLWPPARSKTPPLLAEFPI